MKDELQMATGYTIAGGNSNAINRNRVQELEAELFRLRQEIALMRENA